MKQLLEEVYKVTKWCECCKHTYLAEKKGDSATCWHEEVV